jgi:hypothetical protein
MITRTRTASRRYTLTEFQKWAEQPPPEEEAPPSELAARKAIDRARPYHFLFDSEPIFSAAVEGSVDREDIDESPDADTASLGKSFSGREVQLSSYVVSYAASVTFVEDHITDALRNVIYLGPLRENPKRLYEISGETPLDVGIRGQFSPEILLRNRNRALLRQVNTWMHNFELPGDLECQEIADMAFKLNLVQEGVAPTNFADLGFGFSQLLPLLVQGLVAPKNEHLLLGLRRMIAERRISERDVAIYFTEPSETTSVVRHVPLQPNGHIELEDWPKGFFEDSISQSFALASAQASRKRDD